MSHESWEKFWKIFLRFQTSNEPRSIFFLMMQRSSIFSFSRRKPCSWGSIDPGKLGYFAIKRVIYLDDKCTQTTGPIYIWFSIMAVKFRIFKREWVTRYNTRSSVTEYCVFQTAVLYDRMTFQRKNKSKTRFYSFGMTLILTKMIDLFNDAVLLLKNSTFLPETYILYSVQCTV